MDKTKWIIALIATFLLVGAVQAAMQYHIYLPVVRVDPTLTPTITPSPTITPTPTKTGTPTSGLEITDIDNPDSGDPLDEFITIKNFGSSSVNLTDWFVRDDGPNRYNFPDGFRLGAKATVKIVSGAGSDTSSTLYWDSSVEVWNDGGDCGYLRDNSDGDNVLVDIFCYKAAADGTILIIPNP
jgi:hypothetical protein